MPRSRGLRHSQAVRRGIEKKRHRLDPKPDSFVAPKFESQLMFDSRQIADELRDANARLEAQRRTMDMMEAQLQEYAGKVKALERLVMYYMPKGD
jgi:hypothetical protein